MCQECDRLSEVVSEQQKKIEELEKRLSKYENAHTPPSLRGGFRRKLIPREEYKKPGQKEGHEGTTRALPIPTMSIQLLEEKCKHCNNKLSKPFKIESRIIEEIPEPKPIEVTKYKIGHYKCSKCGKITIAESKLPDGRFGNNVIAQSTLMKYDNRLPYRKVAETLERQYGLTITPACVLDLTRRASEALKADYKEILKKVRRAKIIYIDETSIDVGGRKFWLWIFVTSKYVFVVIRKSRSKKVLEEILGKNFKGVIVCDGHKAYSEFTDKLQRCWAHLLREAKQFAEKFNSGLNLHEGLKKIYVKVKAVTFKVSNENRKKLYDSLVKELKQWVEYANCYKELRKFAIKISNGLGYFFTRVLNPKIEPTNNIAERALREHVVIRKIIGTLRNEKGTSIHETIMTMFATWKKLGLNIYTELKARLN
jgi:transposase